MAGSSRETLTPTIQCDGVQVVLIDNNAFTGGGFQNGPEGRLHM